MDLESLSADDRRALAEDPSTDPDTLSRLAAWTAVRRALATNPSTPAEVRERIYHDNPHLRPTPPQPAAPVPTYLSSPTYSTPPPSPIGPPARTSGFSKFISVLGVIALVGMGIWWLTSCQREARAAAVTCDEYGQMTVAERGDLHRTLLDAHNLIPDAYQNLVGIETGIAAFCGTSQNRFLRVSDGIDWDSPYW